MVSFFLYNIIFGLKVTVARTQTAIENAFTKNLNSDIFFFHKVMHIYFNEVL